MSKNAIYGFGVDPQETLNHFYVVMPAKSTNKPVEIYERFEWTPENLTDEEKKAHAGLKGNKKPTVYAYGQIIEKTDVLRLQISRHKWDLISKDLTSEFNTRLRETKNTSGKFLVGGIPVERLFGKEMMVLLWAIEDCEPSNIPTAIRNWKGLMPEERWWLYTMTNASTGSMGDRRGWRTALKYALCENPVIESRQTSMIDIQTEAE